MSEQATYNAPVRTNEGADANATPGRKYQLCRMILINAGTNKHVPSGRITAIDPRGGAAVVGDNGVGKTTTLRILPLFFGHSPSQIVAAGHGQNTMVQFVIPTEASAIAFEYQRGSDNPDDLRLVVIRRRSDDPDVPFYRLYRSGYRRDLFVGDGRFLTDEETQQRATELGIVTSSKLNTTEYRSVILRTPIASKDRHKLRAYSTDWSFGPKQLDNMDRLVAAMVKKNINFADIVQVAVGLVQHDLGLGAEKAKITLKMGREPIERWLRNRDACKDAFSRKNDFERLEEQLREHRAAEAQFRVCRADVNAVTAYRQQEYQVLEGEIRLLGEERALQEKQEATRKQELQEAAADSASKASSSKKAADDAMAEAQSFETEDAYQWALRLEELPTLRSNLTTAQEQVRAAESDHQLAATHYASLKQDAINRANAATLELEQSKDPHRQRLADALSNISKAEADAQATLEEQAAAKRMELELQKEPLLERRGICESQKKSPNASAEALSAQDEAGTTLQRKTEECATQKQHAVEKMNDLERERRAFHDQEQEVARAKANLAAAQTALELAQSHLNPVPGTLLAALRANVDFSDFGRLARVVDPQLLQREDLAPELIEDGAGTLYGWRLETSAIPLPDWADDAQARYAIDAAHERLEQAKIALQSQLEKLAELSKKLRDIELNALAAQAKSSALDLQLQDCKSNLEAARLRVRNERANAVQLAEKELGFINGALNDLRHQLTDVDRTLSVATAQNKQTHSALRQQAQKSCDASVGAIDTSIARLAADLQQSLQKIEDQLLQHLSEKGVDVERLASLKAEVLRFSGQIQEREKRGPLVARWKAWTDAGGHATVEALKAAAKRASEASAAAAKQHSEYLQTLQKAAQAYESTIGGKSKRFNTVTEEIETLVEMQDSFGDYMATGVSVVDPSTSANTLKAKARGLRMEIDRLETNIRNVSKTLLQALTARASNIKELVDSSLADTEADSVVSRAMKLCTCYRQIGQQVVYDINNTLRTLLTNIGAFQKDIRAFEKQVNDFNRRLKDGLTEVKCFDRVEDLQLNIVTNFDNLGFYKKLTKMEDVVRNNATEVGKDYTRDLPSDETARALSEFMSVLSNDGTVEVNFAQHITLSGSVIDNGKLKEFKRAQELQSISSEGLTSLILITLMTALLNTIRGSEPVHVPWITDEVGKFDPHNFKALMQRLRDNMIDVVTASPELGPSQQAMFAQRYLFEDKGRIRVYQHNHAGDQYQTVSTV